MDVTVFNAFTPFNDWGKPNAVVPLPDSGDTHYWEKVQAPIYTALVLALSVEESCSEIFPEDAGQVAVYIRHQFLAVSRPKSCAVFTAKKKGKGVGLGLFVVYCIIKERGGTLYVDSEPGK
ncbi:MAG: hypothetical protein V6Z89_22705 [Desulfobacter sp.]